MTKIVHITLDNGSVVETTMHPVIVSASRATDIPAFYAPWFANRLREGFVCVRNPYYPGQVSRYRLDPSVVDVIGFCTKNPAPMFPYMDLLKDYGQYWFVSITPYGRDIEPNVPDNLMEDKTQRNRDYDLRTRETHAGPHRDDLCIRVNGMDLRVYGSQGQQRTAAVSMKTAEIAVTEKIRKVSPVLLLDDVLSELDRDRQNALLGGISNTQTIITCTGLDDYIASSFQANHIFRVSSGSVVDETSEGI